MSSPVRFAMIGCGAIGTALLEFLARNEPLQAEQQIHLSYVIVPARSVQRVQTLLARLGMQAQVSTSLADHYNEVDIVIECAGHQALQTHVVPALAQGRSAIIASVGACANEALFTELVQAGRLGGGRMQFVAGAIGAIDALSAARHGGLEQVHYTGVKPALAWADTPAEQVVELAALTQATVFFEGNARQAAQQYPKNANVAATVALAGVGFEATKVQLIADPQATQNSHTIEAMGGFGQLSFEIVAHPLPTNPKTSAITAYSLIQAVLNRVQSWHF